MYLRTFYIEPVHSAPPPITGVTGRLLKTVLKSPEINEPNTDGFILDPLRIDEWKQRMFKCYDTLFKKNDIFSDD